MEERQSREFSKNCISINWFIGNKWLTALVVIAILMTIASAVTLVVLGLIISPWLVVPCLLLFTAVLVGIKFFYEKENVSKFKTHHAVGEVIVSKEEKNDDFNDDLEAYSVTPYNQTSSVTEQALVPRTGGEEVVIHNQKEVVFEEETTINNDEGSYFARQAMQVVDINSGQVDIKMEKTSKLFNGTNGVAGSTVTFEYHQNPHTPAHPSFWSQISAQITDLVSPSYVSKPAALPSTIT